MTGQVCTFWGKLFPVRPVHRNKVYLLYNPMIVGSFLRVRQEIEEQQEKKKTFWEENLWVVMDNK